MSAAEDQRREDPKMRAAVEFLRRTGAQSIEFRFDEGEPVVCMAVATYALDGDRRPAPEGEPFHEVDAALDPLRAVLRLCERMADGGECAHCHRTTGLEPDSLDTMPLNAAICWYQYDPELQKFRRGCE